MHACFIYIHLCGMYLPPGAVRCGILAQRRLLVDKCAVHLFAELWGILAAGGDYTQMLPVDSTSDTSK